MDLTASRPQPASAPPEGRGGLPVIQTDGPPKPRYARAVEVGLRSLHVVSMALVLGGIAMGGTHETLRGPVAATVVSGLLLLAASVRWRCINLTQGAGWALFLKLALLGLGNVFDGARLHWYVAATLVTSVGSHMPSSWRHFSLPGRASRSGTRAA